MRKKSSRLKKEKATETLIVRITKSKKKELMDYSNKEQIPMTTVVVNGIDMAINPRHEKTKVNERVSPDVIKLIEEANSACDVWNFMRTHEVPDECNVLFDRIMERGKELWDIVLH